LGVCGDNKSRRSSYSLQTSSYPDVALGLGTRRGAPKPVLPELLEIVDCSELLRGEKLKKGVVIMPFMLSGDAVYVVVVDRIGA
jgi:hypothetical protein